LINVYIYTSDFCAPCKHYKEDLISFHPINDSDVKITFINTTKEDLTDSELSFITLHRVRSVPSTIIEFEGKTYYNGNSCKTSTELKKLINEAREHFKEKGND
jgi:arsenate reductase-like glutaredoxin family protein